MAYDDDGPWEAKGYEWDEGNEEYATRRAAAEDIEHALDDAEAWAPSKDEAGRWITAGRGRGGQWLTVVCAYDTETKTLRPITCWPSSDVEVQKFQ